jgi:uncharacterized protein
VSGTDGARGVLRRFIGAGVQDYGQTYNLDVWKTDECLDCAYLPLCFGGCRFLRRLRTGAIDGVDCRKAIYDARWKL